MEHSGALGQWSHQVHASVHDMINAWNLILDTCISTRGTLSLDDNPIKETFLDPFSLLWGFFSDSRSRGSLGWDVEGTLP